MALATSAGPPLQLITRMAWALLIADLVDIGSGRHPPEVKIENLNYAILDHIDSERSSSPQIFNRRGAYIAVNSRNISLKRCVSPVLLIHLLITISNF